MASVAIPEWRLEGTVVQACNCNWGCPCDFNAPPSKGYCEGTWTWHIERGRFGDVTLDGLSFAAACKWPGAVHEGNGEVTPILDDRAGPEQLQAIGTLLGGQAGGPWAVIGGTFTNVYEPMIVHWDVRLDGVQTTIVAGDALTMKLQPMRNPITGDVHEATVSLPTGFIAKAMHKAASSALAVRGPVAYDHSGQDAAWGSFAYRGPN